ncbi:hypothetical protein BS641_00195 [Mycobacterium avium subsp. hominissuis]|nr:hypothetical protein BS641_00195 [Mycobacterium avium subsp. hominissuis]
MIWLWANSARGIVGAPRLGPRLYALGYNPNIETIPIAEGVADLKSPNGQAILMEPYATIFSHLMLKSADEVEQMVREGIA